MHFKLFVSILHPNIGNMHLTSMVASKMDTYGPSRNMNTIEHGAQGTGCMLVQAVACVNHKNNIKYCRSGPRGKES